MDHRLDDLRTLRRYYSKVRYNRNNNKGKVTATVPRRFIGHTVVILIQRKCKKDGF